MVTRRPADGGSSRGRDALDDRVEPAPIEDDPVRSQLVARVQPPPLRTAVPVTAATAPISGQRVVWQSPKGWHFDIRAVGEPYSDGGDDASLMVDVVAEIDWYRSRITGAPVTPVAVFAHTVFIERPFFDRPVPDRPVPDRPSAAQ